MEVRQPPHLDQCGHRRDAFGKAVLENAAEDAAKDAPAIAPLAALFGHMNARPLVYARSTRNAVLSKTREDFAQEMRFCRGDKPRAADNRSALDRQQIDSIVVVELVALARIGLRQVSPLALTNVDVVTQPESLIEFKFVEPTVSRCDDMNHRPHPSRIGIHGMGFSGVARHELV